MYVYIILYGGINVIMSCETGKTTVAYKNLFMSMRVSTKARQFLSLYVRFLYVLMKKCEKNFECPHSCYFIYPRSIVIY